MLAQRTAPTGSAYTGAIYVDSGPPFNNFVGSGTPTPVGNGTLTFSNADSGVFAYSLNAGTGGSPVPVSQIKAIERYNLGTGPQPTCTYSPTADLASATNYQDYGGPLRPAWARLPKIGNRPTQAKYALSFRDFYAIVMYMTGKLACPVRHS